MRSIRYVFTLLIFLTVVAAYAQPTTRPSLRVGFGLQGIAYLGDLVEPQSGIRRLSAGGELSLERLTHRSFGTSFHLGAGSFSEQYDQPGTTGSSFVQTRFLGGDLRAHWRGNPQGRLQPQVAIGAGLLSFAPEDRDGVPLSGNNGVKRYATIIPQIPMQAGLRWQVNRSVGFSLNYTYRFTPTDYLDNLQNEDGRSGFDALHSLQLGFEVDLGEEPVPPASRPTTNAPATQPEAEQVSGSAEPTVAPATNTAPMADTPEEATTYDLAAIEAAIESESFRYYETKRSDTLAGLAERFGIPSDLIRELNYLASDQLVRGTLLRIPDVPKP